MDSISAILDSGDDVLRAGRVALLCNQVSFSFERQDYLYRLLGRRGNLIRCFLPEHGLFAELQDQVALDDAGVYAAGGTDFVSLYGSAESSLSPHNDLLVDIDALVVDVQDVGARYYTFFVSTVYLLRALARVRRGAVVYVLDRPNPAGRQVEGTPLPADYESFVGLPGMVHRHGLTLGELCRLFAAEESWPLELRVVPAPAPTFSGDGVFDVPPSPNMPNWNTARVYAGQCLLEGTNVSEGRGTTRPFEICGAPYIRAFDQAPRGKDGALGFGGGVLRPLRFVPAFHKYAGEVCEGWQVYPRGSFHSLAFTLGLIRHLRDSCAAFRYRSGIYEFRSDRPAIEILVGDRLLLDFLDGRAPEIQVREKLRAGERDWVERARPFLLYGEELFVSPDF